MERQLLELVSEVVQGRALRPCERPRLLLRVGAARRQRDSDEQEGEGAHASSLPRVRLLVTGAAGFIGSNFVRYWLDRRPDDHVVAYDLLTYAGNRASLADLEESIVFVHGDIADGDLAERVVRDEEIDTIVNFAAESHNSLAVIDPTRFFRTNVLGTQTLLDVARTAGVRRFHHVSTCEVYGDLALDSDEAFTEEHPYRPRTPYNASKAGADHAVRGTSRRTGSPSRSPTARTTTGRTSFRRR